MYVYVHIYAHSHTRTANTPIHWQLSYQLCGNCAMENKHLLYCVSSIVFEYKGQHITADNFNSNNSDCRPCQYSLLLMN